MADKSGGGVRGDFWAGRAAAGIFFLSFFGFMLAGFFCGRQLYGLLSAEAVGRHIGHMVVLSAFFSAAAGALFAVFAFCIVGHMRKRRGTSQNIELGDAILMLKYMLKSLSNGVIAYRLPNREILMINDEAKRICGFEEEVSARIFDEYLREKVMPGNEEAIRRAVGGLKKPGNAASYMFDIRRESGEVIKVWAYTRLLQFTDGTQFILSSLLDITERFRLDAMLRQERKQYREALTNNCEYCYSFDVTEGLIRQEFVTADGANPLHELGLELPVEYDLLNERWIERWKPEFSGEHTAKFLNRESLLQSFENGDTMPEIEYYNRKRDTYIRAITLLSRSEETGHVMGIVVANNITEVRKEQEQKKRELMRAKEALEDAYEAARRANEAKSVFLSQMSHDIRTPMNAIIGMTAIAGAHLEDKQRVADCLDKITVSGRHLLGLINEVLDMSKIESGKMSLYEEEFSLADSIESLLTMSRPQIAAKGLELLAENYGVEHEKVMGDSQRLQQVFMNVMSNAVKYTQEGGRIWLRVSEKAADNSRAGCYEFVFQDNGIGMSKEFLKNIYEPFTREEDARTRQVQGTGLGMAITKNVVEMMNGGINVESELGKGTRVVITVLLKLQGEGEKEECEGISNLPVLVVNGDRTACEAACRMLEELGMKGEWALSAKEAKKQTADRRSRGEDFFAVLLDWKMPGTCGAGAVKQIKDCAGAGTHIVVSAYDCSSIEQEARAAGAGAFVAKPLFKSRMAQLFKELAGHAKISGRQEAFEAFSKEDFTGKRALLVEDNELNSEIAEEIFAMAKLQVDFAGNGREALEIVAGAEEGYYDIIFMDIQMPVMDGYEAAKAIRALPGEYAGRVPIIAMTANAFAEDVKKTMEAGMNEHITKPLDFGRLVRILRKWIR